MMKARFGFVAAERFGVNRIGDTRQLPDIVHTFTPLP